jgi:hypothetical protein
LTGDALQAGDDRVEFCVELIQATQGCKRALLGFTGGIAVGLYELDVVIGAAAGDFDEHATTVSQLLPCINSINWHFAPLQNFDFKSEDR